MFHGEKCHKPWACLERKGQEGCLGLPASILRQMLNGVCIGAIQEIKYSSEMVAGSSADVL